MRRSEADEGADSAKRQRRARSRSGGRTNNNVSSKPIGYVHLGPQVFSLTVGSYFEQSVFKKVVHLVHSGTVLLFELILEPVKCTLARDSGIFLHILRSKSSNSTNSTNV